MLRFLVSNRRERQQFEHLAGPIEFGRGPERDSIPRCVVQDGYVSKDHVRLEEMADSQVKVENLSLRNSIRLADNTAIEKGETRVLRTPVRLMVGETIIEAEAAADPVSGGPLETIAAPVRGRPSIADPAAATRAASMTVANAAVNTMPEARASLLDLGKTPTVEKLIEWFETFVAVQRAAAGSPEFYQQTAEAVVKLIGLDRGLVILRSPRTATGGPASSRWMVHSRFPDDGSSQGREFSLTILDKVVKDRRTYFQSSAAPPTTESLQGVEAVVASPIFDPREEVVGFVYGCRTRFTAQRGIGVGGLEAQVMQVLAASVATGLARQQLEAEASRSRVQFEQFVSAELAQELQSNPTLLTGQEREITVLFCDIRGFSRMAEKLGPQTTCELVSSVMDRLTECIRQFDGTVVDYAGDGVMAMWNAPVTQPDHASRAARAALAMRAVLPHLDSEWQDRLGQTIRVGIGINSGPAMVGNTGCKLRFKYGALGHTVNLASRVESATKQLGMPLMITGSTRAHLGDTFATRRLCKVRVFGIQGVVDLYELYGEQAAPTWQSRRDVYEQALNYYESGEFSSSCKSLYPLLANQDGNYDVPSLNLVQRAIEAIKNPPEKFDGVVDLLQK